MPETDENDWQHRARLEAVAILEANGMYRAMSWDDAVSMMAIAWLQGVNLGAHDTLRISDAAFQRLRADLA